jgi:hypothetical protein
MAWLKRAPAAEAVRQDILDLLGSLDSPGQVAALETLEELESETQPLDPISWLVKYRLADAAKARLIGRLASAPHPQAIVPLFVIVAGESRPVRSAALVALAEHRNLMPLDVRYFFRLVSRATRGGAVATWPERLFLWAFAKRHQELDGVVKKISARKGPCCSYPIKKK